MKYIYSVSTKFEGIIKNAYLREDVYNDIFFSFDEAVTSGVNTLNNSLNSYLRYLNLTFEDISDDLEQFIDYSFIVKKISCNFNNFQSDEELQKYYKETITAINKNQLYDYLLSILDCIDYELDLYGNIIGIETNDNINYFSPKSFDINSKYHLNKFKIGDKVKVKYIFGESEKIYEIFDIINKDNSIYDSDDPLYFKQGYALTDIYNDYCNKYTGLHFDEDLIASSDEEYYNFYKSWNWYDNENNIIGTYADYMNGEMDNDKL